MRFDPDAPDQIVRRARIVLADLLMRTFIVADEKPSKALADYFQEHLREQERYEAEMQARYDSLTEHPGVLPLPKVRRVT